MKHKFLSFVCLLLLATTMYAQNWKLEVHTDDFGDKIPGGYFIWNIIEDASMSNSATKGAKSAVIVQFENPESIVIRTFDYGLSNPANTYLDDYVIYGFKDEQGRVLRFSVSSSGYNSGTHLNKTQSVALREIFATNKIVKCFIEFGRSKYVFKIDNTNFKEVFIDFLDKYNYSDEELYKLMDIESNIMNQIDQKIMKELQYEYISPFSVKEYLDEIKKFFPNEYTKVMDKYKEKNLKEWVIYYSDKIGVDLINTMDEEELKHFFSIFDIEVVPLKEETKKNTLVMNNDSVEEENPITKPKVMYTEADSLYFYIGSYGIGLRSIIGENAKNYFSNGFSYGIEWFGNKHHGLHSFVGIYSNGEQQIGDNDLPIDLIFGYSYRKALSSRFEFILRTGVTLTMEKFAYIPLDNNTYDKKEIIPDAFSGLRLSTGFNFFMTEGFNINFGLADRLAIISEVYYDSFKNYKRDKADNLFEVYFGIGWSFL